MELDAQYLLWVYEKYQEVKNSTLSQKTKNIRYADLMTNLESHFEIPFLMEDAADNIDKEVFELYQEISFARDFSVNDND